jgi:hypothetical protein
VQRKAQERIAHASDIAVLQILALMQAPDTPAPVKLAAARDLLDRASLTGKTIIEVEVPAWQQLLDGIVATVEPGQPIRAFAESQPELDVLAVEASRVDQERELANYTPDDADWSHPEAYGHDLPTTLPYPKRRANAPTAEEPATRRANGDDTPPPRHPLPERRRIEPDDEPKLYAPSPRPPRRGRVAGRR